jgi:hypothetical protein
MARIISRGSSASPRIECLTPRVTIPVRVFTNRDNYILLYYFIIGS